MVTPAKAMKVTKQESKNLDTNDWKWPDQIEEMSCRALRGITWAHVCLANHIDEKLIPVVPLEFTACTSRYHLEKTISFRTEKAEDEMKQTRWQTSLDCQGRYTLTDLWGLLAQQSVCDKNFVRKLVESNQDGKERVNEFVALFPTSPARQILLMCLVAMLRICGRKVFPDAGWSLQYPASQFKKAMPQLSLSWFCSSTQTTPFSVYYSRLLGATDYTITFDKPTLSWCASAGIQLLAPLSKEYTNSPGESNFDAPMFLTSAFTFVLPYCRGLPSLFRDALLEAQDKRKIQFSITIPSGNEVGPTRVHISGVGNNLLFVESCLHNSGVSLNVVSRDTSQSIPIEKWLPLLSATSSK